MCTRKMSVVVINTRTHVPVWWASKAVAFEYRVSWFSSHQTISRRVLINSLRWESPKRLSRFVRCTTSVLLVPWTREVKRYHRDMRFTDGGDWTTVCSWTERLREVSISKQMSYRPTSARRQQTTSTNPITGEKIDYSKKTHFGNDQTTTMYVRGFVTDVQQYVRHDLYL